MLSYWDFRAILGVDPDQDKTCVGIACPNGQKCTSFIATTNLQEASRLLNQMNQTQHFIDTKEDLRHLAILLLCDNYHVTVSSQCSQRDEVVRKWLKVVVAMQNTIDWRRRGHEVPQNREKVEPMEERIREVKRHKPAATTNISNLAHVNTLTADSFATSKPKNSGIFDLGIFWFELQPYLPLMDLCIKRQRYTALLHTNSKNNTLPHVQDRPVTPTSHAVHGIYTPNSTPVKKEAKVAKGHEKRPSGPWSLFPYIESPNFSIISPETVFPLTPPASINKAPNSREQLPPVNQEPLKLTSGKTTPNIVLFSPKIASDSQAQKRVKREESKSKLRDLDDVFGEPHKPYVYFKMGSQSNPFVTPQSASQCSIGYKIRVKLPQNTARVRIPICRRSNPLIVPQSYFSTWKREEGVRVRFPLKVVDHIAPIPNTGAQDFPEIPSTADMSTRPGKHTEVFTFGSRFSPSNDIPGGRAPTFEYRKLGSNFRTLYLPTPSLESWNSTFGAANIEDMFARSASKSQDIRPVLSSSRQSEESCDSGGNAVIDAVPILSFTGVIGSRDGGLEGLDDHMAALERSFGALRIGG